MRLWVRGYGYEASIIMIICEYLIPDSGRPSLLHFDEGSQVTHTRLKFHKLLPNLPADHIYTYTGTKHKVTL